MSRETLQFIGNTLSVAALLAPIGAWLWARRNGWWTPWRGLQVSTGTGVASGLIWYLVMVLSTGGALPPPMDIVMFFLPWATLPVLVGVVTGLFAGANPLSREGRGVALALDSGPPPWQTRAPLLVRDDDRDEPGHEVTAEGLLAADFITGALPPQERVAFVIRMTTEPKLAGLMHCLEQLRETLREGERATWEPDQQ